MNSFRNLFIYCTINVSVYNKNSPYADKASLISETIVRHVTCVYLFFTSSIIFLDAWLAGYEDKLKEII
jgi:hypothetical protein